MTPPGELLPGRRQVVRTAVVAVVAVVAATTSTVLAGCLPGDDEPEPPDPELLLRARVADEVRALAARYAATVDQFPVARPELATLGAEHEEHARALLPRRAARALATATATATATGTASSTAEPTPTVPSTLRAARAELAGAELAASGRRLRQMQGRSPELARLLASVAACEAAHAALLWDDA